MDYLGRILIDSGGFVRGALSSYTDSLAEQLLSPNLTSSEYAVLNEAYSANSALLKDLGTAIAVISIINSLAHGDIKGAAISAVAYFNPLAAAALQALDMLAGAVAGGNQTFEADGKFVNQADGSLGLAIGNHNGGANVAWNQVMGSLLDQTQKQAEATTAIYGVPMGILAARMPNVSFKAGEMFLNITDPETGAVSTRTFSIETGQYLIPGFVEDIFTSSPWDTQDGNSSANRNQFFNRNVSERDAGTTGNAHQAAQDDRNFFLNIAQQFTDLVAANNAIVPMWEVETAVMQGKLANNWAATRGVASENYYKIDHDGTANTQRSRITPVVLDMDGSRDFPTTNANQGAGVLFDADNDGFAEHTDWIGPRDGFLVLDRNGDGHIDKGGDLLTGNLLPYLSGNGDLFLTAADPVFAHLQVWQDIDQDGVAQDYELRHLSDVGITEISTLAEELGARRNGESQRMREVRLFLTPSSAATQAIGGNALLVTPEAGTPYLQATAVYDYGSNTTTTAGHVHTISVNGTAGMVTATDEMLDGQEDTRIVVSVEQLLQNDKAISGAATFSLTADATGGVASYNAANKTISFTPDENFNSKTGGMASFGYTVTDAQGHSVQATAFVDVGSVDDPAEMEYGFGRRQGTWGDIGLNRNAAGTLVYEMPNLDEVNLEATRLTSAEITVLGYAGENAQLNPYSSGVIGFANGKLYFAWFDTPGDPQTQQAWQEVWVNTGGKGTITVSDADYGEATPAPGTFAFTEDANRSERYGHVTLVDNHDGTASFSYDRTSFLASSPRFVQSGDGGSSFQPAVTGPQDAFYVRVRQTVDGKEVDAYQKILLDAPTLLGNPEVDFGRVTLANGSLSGSDGGDASATGTGTGGGGGAPIILDLNDNGFKFTAANNSTAFYDLAGDGVRRATAWASGMDGILAYDANNDGKISGKAEISFKGYLAGAATDLEGLRAFDTNNDGKFSSADAQWNKFRVWQDKNEDGNQTLDELSTLAERGISSINLTSDGVASSAGGVTVHGVGSYTRIDGSQAQLADVELAYTSETLASVGDDTVTVVAASASQGGTVNTGGGNDSITGSALGDQISAGTGNDLVNAGAGDDQVWGGAGNDRLLGGDGNDTLWGGNGNDVLMGEAGDDKLHGGDGDDTLTGGAGVDTYYVELGGGHDTINETGGEVSRLVLGAGLRAQDAWVDTFTDTTTGKTGYVLHFSADDSLTLHNFSTQALDVSAVQLTYADGSQMSLGQLPTSAPLVSPNHAPTVAHALSSQTASKDSAFSFTVPLTGANATFADADAGDTLTLSATLANGDPLPAWLHFNPATGSFSGTPTVAGSFSIQVRATDPAGASINANFGITVQGPTDSTAPTLTSASPVDDATAVLKSANLVLTFSEAIKAGTGNLLIVNTANSADTRTIAVTDTSQITISGSVLTINPTADLVADASYSVQLASGVVLDLAGNAYAGISNATALNFATASGTNHAPTVATDLTPQSVNEDSAWQFAVPAGTFADSDAGDTLQYSATLADGSALPSWLAFNAGTRSFSGTPLNANVGTVAIKVTATDAGGLGVSSTFNLQVVNTNDAPVVSTPLVAQTATAGQAFSFTVPQGSGSATFTDVDVGDTLTLSASLAGGGNLPSWLHFDAVTGSFSGTPTTTGNVSVQVTATDHSGASISSSFAITVQAGADTTAPTLANATPADDATAVVKSANLMLTFSEAIKAGTGNLLIVNAANSADTRTIAVTDGNQITISGSTLTINPTADLLDGASYSVQLASGVVLDLVGNAYVGISNATTLNFATASATVTYPADALVGTPNNDVLTADSTHKTVYGLAGDDIINGFWDSTTLIGGAGNDTINASGGSANVIDGGDGDDILWGGWGHDIYIGGEGNNTIHVTSNSSEVTAGSGNDIIFGAWGDDVIDAGSGNNQVSSGGGNNFVRTGAGNDTLNGVWGNDVLIAGDGTNTITDTGGRNLLVGGAGSDTIDAQGTNLVVGGAGSDAITFGWGNNWVNAGKGDDQINMAGGTNLMAFNRGDGADTLVNTGWGVNTMLSLGKGILYADLKLARSGNDLVLALGQGDQIALKDWYLGNQYHTVDRLQVLTQGGDYSASSSNALQNKPVTVFDFAQLVSAFDTAVAANANAATGWAVSTSALADAQQYASDVPPVNYINPWVALQAGIDLITQTNAIASNPITTTGTTAAEQLLFAALNTSPTGNAARGWMQ